MNKEYHINGDRYYVSIFKHEFLTEANAIKIYYQSDVPTEQDLKKYLLDRHPDLAKKEIKNIHKINGWEKTETGGSFATILIFFK